MEYLKDGNLEHKKRPKEDISKVEDLEEGFILDCILQITEGLQKMHNLGVVHRDLKPRNVMLDGDRVVLIDFGLSRYMT